MDKDTSIFTDNRPRKIVHGVYLSHYDYSKVRSDFVTGGESTPTSFKIECEKAVFVASRHEEKNE